MQIIRVASASDPRVEDYRFIRERDALGRGYCIAEGETVLHVLLKQARFRPRSILLGASRLEKLGPVLEAHPPTAPILVAEQGVLNEIAGFNIHRGILAAVDLPEPPSFDDVVQRALDARRPLVLLEGLANHDNVGGVFRNAAAFGAAGVVLDEKTADPFYRKAIRVSVGGVFKVPSLRAENLGETVAALRRAGVVVLSLTPSREAVSLYEVVSQLSGKAVAFLFGSEEPGLSANLLRASDRQVRIPQAGDFDSLNVATASGIVMSAFFASGVVRF